jgi:leader peptidase (prepilin peptidase)/N-methyltransferase
MMKGPEVRGRKSATRWTLLIMMRTRPALGFVQGPIQRLTEGFPDNARAWLAATGLIAGALLAGRWGWLIAGPQGALVAAGGACLLALSWVDLRWRVIPGSLLWPGTLLILLGRGLLLPETLPSALLGGLAGWSAFWLLARLSDGQLGGGDVKLAGFIGLLTGLAWLLPALLTGMAVGGVLAFGLVASGRKQVSEGIPYGPALSLGALIALVLAIT